MSSINGSGRKPRLLVYGFGNPGRQDDGAGVVLVEEVEAWARCGDRPWLTFDSNYQLNAEDALTAAGHDIVVFVDASRDQAEGVLFRAIGPSRAVTFSTHAMTPESVLALCRDLYGARPAAHLLTVRGYEWEPNDPMSAAALVNLAAACRCLTPFLENPERLLVVRDDEGEPTVRARASRRGPTP